MTAVYLWVYYVWRPWVPVNLSAIYTTLIHVEPWSAPFVASLLGLLALTGLAWVLRRRHPWVLALWLCHLALLTPILGFGSPFESYSSDRYAYLQGICWALVLGIVLQRLLRLRSEGVRAACLLPCVGALVALSLASQRQAGMWRDSAAFYGTLLRQPGIEQYRSDLHWRLSQHYLDHKDLAAARSALEEGLQLNPRDPLLLYMLAGVHDATGDYDSAEKLVRRSIALNSVPVAWRLLATICLHAGRLPAAQEALNSALTMDPRNGETHYLLAVLRYQQGLATDALSELDRIPVDDPSHVEALNLRAEILQPSASPGPISPQ
jgi:tetratricopeptide (TPR) repeat protein